MTPDEWRALGFDNAIMAEQVLEDNLEQSAGLMNKAVYCFNQTHETRLASRARAYRMSFEFRLILEGRQLSAEEGMSEQRLLVLHCYQKVLLRSLRLC